MPRRIDTSGLRSPVASAASISGKASAGSTSIAAVAASRASKSAASSRPISVATRRANSGSTVLTRGPRGGAWTGCAGGRRQHRRTQDQHGGGEREHGGGDVAHPCILPAGRAADDASRLGREPPERPGERIIPPRQAPVQQ